MAAQGGQDVAPRAGTDLGVGCSIGANQVMEAAGLSQGSGLRWITSSAPPRLPGTESANG